ncbi:MAG TPA: (2Fe-2S) ferredoxin domain-containing protein [Planctomycetota bacterium]
MNELTPKPFERLILVCCNERQPGEAACANRGSGEFQKKLKEYAKSKGLQGKVRVSRSLCLGLCEKGPNICVMPDNVWHAGVTEKDLEEIKKRWIDPMAT